MIGRLGLALALCGIGAAALAEAPVLSPRPDPRPGGVTRAVAVAMIASRPAPVAGRSGKPTRVVFAASPAAVRLSPRPEPRPENLKRRTIVRAAGVRSQPNEPLLKGRRGAVCGNRAIQGARMQPIPGRLAGCGVAEPVRVTSVSGVVLSQPSTMDCRTAEALNAWVVGAVKPAVGRLGGGVAGLKVAAHYSCRTRNGKAGAKISEHGKGRAIDISAIRLQNGVSISVLKGWTDTVHGRILRAVHRSACGPFGTVLGPNADAYHKDHFHLDTARYRGGTYCR